MVDRKGGLQSFSKKWKCLYAIFGRLLNAWLQIIECISFDLLKLSCIILILTDHQCPTQPFLHTRYKSEDWVVSSLEYKPHTTKKNINWRRANKRSLIMSGCHIKSLLIPSINWSWKGIMDFLYNKVRIITKEKREMSLITTIFL